MKCVCNVEMARSLLESYLLSIGMGKEQHGRIKNALRDHYLLYIMFEDGTEFSMPTPDY